MGGLSWCLCNVATCGWAQKSSLSPTFAGNYIFHTTFQLVDGFALDLVKSTIVCKFVVESLSLPVFLSRFSQEALLAGQVNENLSFFL